MVFIIILYLLVPSFILPSNAFMASIDVYGAGKRVIYWKQWKRVRRLDLVLEECDSRESATSQIHQGRYIDSIWSLWTQNNNQLNTLNQHLRLLYCKEDDNFIMIPSRKDCLKSRIYESKYEPL